jgi:HSP20 family protein
MNTNMRIRDPWQWMNEWQKDFDNMFRRLPAKDDDSGESVCCDWVPAVDIKEEDEQFVLHADLPGVAPEDIEVSMENGMLTISGHRHSESKTEEENYRRIERSSGDFYRRFSLPENTDPDNITANGKNGVLEIVIPKVQKAEGKKIDVQVTGE